MAMGRSRIMQALAAAALTLAFASLSAKADEASEAKAVAASKEWLAVVDVGRFDQGWESAAAYLKAAVTKADFVRAVAAVRIPLGKVVARTRTSTQYATSLPGAPDGDYVVIQYGTVFENKKSAVETITPMLDRDGQWRIAGYYIR